MSRRWSTTSPPADVSSTVRSLADVIAFNKRNMGVEMPLFGQDIFDKAQLKYPDDTWTWETYAATAARLTGS